MFWIFFWLNIGKYRNRDKQKKKRVKFSFNQIILKFSIVKPEFLYRLLVRFLSDKFLSCIFEKFDIYVLVFR